MKEQALELISIENDIKNSMKVINYSLLLNSVVTLSCGMAFSLGNSKLRTINLVLCGLNGACVLLNGLRFLNRKAVLEDIKKYRLFLENEKLLNDDIVKNYFELYGSNAPIEEINTITINDLDNYSYNDLEMMVDSIQYSLRQ